MINEDRPSPGQLTRTLARNIEWLLHDHITHISISSVEGLAFVLCYPL